MAPKILKAFAYSAAAVSLVVVPSIVQNYMRNYDQFQSRPDGAERTYITGLISKATVSKTPLVHQATYTSLLFAFYQSETTLLDGLGEVPDGTVERIKTVASVGIFPGWAFTICSTEFNRNQDYALHASEFTIADAVMRTEVAKLDSLVQWNRARWTSEQ